MQPHYRPIDLVPGNRTYVAALQARPDFSRALATPTGDARKLQAVAALQKTEGAARSQIEPQLGQLRDRGLLTSWEFVPLTGALLLHVPTTASSAGWQAIRGVEGLGRIVRNHSMFATPGTLPPGTPPKVVPEQEEPKPLVPTTWQLDATGARAAWQQGATGTGVTIGFIDSGFDPTHPALRPAFRGTRPDGSIDPSYNFYDPVDGNAMPFDDRGHGTMTTGLAVGQGTGVAPDAKFISAKVFSNSGKSSLANTLKAMAWMLAPRDAADANPDPTRAPDIVNMSFGGRDGTSLKYLDALRAFNAAGILPVASAGNGGPRPGSINTPASYPQTIAVGASDSRNQVWSKSGRGPGPTLPSVTGSGVGKPDVVAPGVDVLTSALGGGLAPMTGTSASAPVASGVAALVLSANPGMSATDLRTALARGARDIDLPGFDHNAGNGLVDAPGALRIADRMARIRRPA